MGARLARRLERDAGDRRPRTGDRELGPLPVTAGLGTAPDRAAPRHRALGVLRAGQRDPDPACRDRSRDQGDHAEHERLLRGARRAARAARRSRCASGRRERRICQLVQYELPNRLPVPRRQPACDGLSRETRAWPTPSCAAPSSFVERAAELEETVILAGDFNITREQSETIRALIDGTARVALHRRRAVDRPRPRPRRGCSNRPRVARRGARVHGRLLSDHAPVEVEFTPARAAA